MIPLTATWVILATVSVSLVYSQTPPSPGMDPVRSAVKRHDYAQALQEITLLANNGVLEAQYTLGTWYHETGKFSGVPQDNEKAFKYFSMAAERGHLSAQTYLGLLYFRGEGVPKDDVQAVKWFRGPAEAGDVGAQLQLAECYSEGYGSLKKNDVEALKWYLATVPQYSGVPRIESYQTLLARMSQNQVAQATEAAAPYVKQAEVLAAAEQQKEIQQRTSSASANKKVIEDVKKAREAESKGHFEKALTRNVVIRATDGQERDQDPVSGLWGLPTSSSKSIYD